MKTNRTEANGLIRSGADRKGILLKTNVILLFSLILIIFVLPAFASLGSFITSALLCTIVISGLFAADFSRTAFRVIFFLGTLVVLAILINLFFPDFQNFNALTFLLVTLFFIIVTIALVAHVASAKEVYSSTLLCAINSYLLIGLTLSILLMIMDLFLPGSFTEVDSLSGNLSVFTYYGFVTLTTLGFGDITPDTELARSLSTFTALFGQLYLVIIMALIIGKYLKGKPGED